MMIDDTKVKIKKKKNWSSSILRGKYDHEGKSRKI